MMQHSFDCTTTVNVQEEKIQRLDFVDDTVKRDCSESIDGSSTPVYNLSSKEGHLVHSKYTNTAHRIRIIILSVVLGLSVLGLGYWTGRVLGKRKNSLNFPTTEINPFDPITDSPVGYPVNMPSFIPEVSRKPIAIENHNLVPVFDTGVSSDSLVGSNAEALIKPQTGSPTMPVNNFEPPTTLPTGISTLPSTTPSTAPKDAPSIAPTHARNDNDPVGEVKPAVTYFPGNLTRLQNNLLLSEGLEARIIAQTGEPVKLADGSSSDINFHIFPDAGGTFPDTRWWNIGGWIYVSNSEARNKNEGGVGAITFDKHGSVVHYRMVLENTRMNCGGGRTPWNTWVSCEEVEFTGQIYQVDPTGQRPSEQMSLGSAGGRWESFAYDIRDRDKPHFFSTEDHNKGCTRRFTPNVTHWGGDEWKMLHEEGVVDYLSIISNDQRTGGTFEWTDDFEAAKNNARTFYPQSEGIDIQNGKMYIVCKNIQQLFIFDLDQMTFHNMSTVSGLFDGDPDQMQRILGSEDGLLYFTEEGGESPGVHARDKLGRFFTILESPIFFDETTGLSFSPDGKHMYIAYQENGILFDVTREDGLTFDAKSLDVKYHHSMSSRRLNSQWVGM